MYSLERKRERDAMFSFLSLSRWLFFSYQEKEKENGCMSIHLHWSIVLDEMQLGIEQPQFLLEPTSTYVLESQPIELQCQAIRTRRIFFNCDQKWLHEQEHRKSSQINVSESFLLRSVFISIAGERSTSRHRLDRIESESGIQMFLSGLVSNRWNAEITSRSHSNRL